MSRLRSLAPFSLLFPSLLGACGAVSGGDPTAVSVAALDDAPGPSCNPYPIELRPAPTAQAKAQATLDLLAAEAGSHPSMEWSDPRGTFRAVYGIAYPLASCNGTSSEDAQTQPRVEDALWTLFGHGPGLFRLAQSEWVTLNSTRCQDVDPSQTLSLVMRRRSFGGVAEREDILFALVRRVDGLVRLESISGDFLPPAPLRVAASMRSCPSLDPAGAEATARDADFNYSIFAACAYVGSGVYHAQKADTFSLEPSRPWWTWQDGVDLVTLSKFQRGFLVLDRSSWTPELINSDAFCGETIGWVVTFDAVTGKITAIQPGINCIVC